jgi:hypothetical protein
MGRKGLELIYQIVYPLAGQSGRIAMILPERADIFGERLHLFRGQIRHGWPHDP